MNADTIEQVVRVNLLDTFNVLCESAAVMAKNDPDAGGQRGVVITTSSIAAFDGQTGQAPYAASKGGIAALTLPAARDLAPLGVRVATIAPGTFGTPLLAGLPEGLRHQLAAAVPCPPRMGRPEEFAGLAVHICANDYLNGAVLRLDGAQRLPAR